MKSEEHLENARQWGKAAQCAKEQGQELVLPHASFYEAANYIEAVLAERKIHSDDHLQRVRNMYESGRFSFDEVQFFEKVTRQRIIVEFQMPSRPLKEVEEVGRIFRQRWERDHPTKPEEPAEAPTEEAPGGAPEKAAEKPAKKKTKKAAAKKKVSKKKGSEKA
ncbi:MAG: hypothetical protein QF415_07090 [Candidatus Undinarchaeales archaeon]|jgi:hypothetical protein|nr:hypothetical protein [Candidatus Undinarchaeales archaeon]MDP7494036.1 hypothetical protein [Candidatus Undinarchaeales archaeon]